MDRSCCNLNLEMCYLHFEFANREIFGRVTEISNFCSYNEDEKEMKMK